MTQVECHVCRGKLIPLWDDVKDSDGSMRFSIAECNECGLKVTWPRPENLNAYYEKSYHGGRHGFTAGLCDRRRMKIVRSLGPFPSERRLLDVGCGDGTFLKAAKRDGWKVRGIEKYSGQVHAYGLEVDENWPGIEANQSYDCITMWHVLEHLTDLHEAIRSIDRLLKPNGVVVIAVPDADSLQARWFSGNWMHLDVPRHLYHFSEHSLRLLLFGHGFDGKRLCVSEFEYDLMGWAQSSLTAIGFGNNTFFKLLSGRSINVPFWKRAMIISSGSLVCIIGCIPTWLLGRIGHGGTLVFAASKNSKVVDV